MAFYNFATMISDSKIKTVHILGLGAMGCLYASRIYDYNPDAVRIIVDPKRKERYEGQHFTVNKKQYQFKFLTEEDCAGKADLLIIAVKYAGLKSAIEYIKPFIGPHTVVMSLLNGISSEEMIGNVIGMDHMIYAFGVGMDAFRNASEVSFQNPGKLVFGEKINHQGHLSKRIERISDFFKLCKIPYEIPEDMMHALWYKFMLNVGINQASAVLKSPNRLFQKNPYARNLMIAAAEEVRKIAVHKGIQLTDQDLEDFKKAVDDLNPDGKTSMLQDTEAGRNTEVELFAGTVIKYGKEGKIPTPVNKMLYNIIKSREPF